MPIYTPIIIRSGSIEVLSDGALTFNAGKERWEAQLPDLYQASIHLAVLHNGNELSFYNDASMGDRLLLLEGQGSHPDLELVVSATGALLTIGADPGKGQKVGRRRLYQVPLKIDAVTLEDGAGTPLAQFDKVRGVIALVETVETRHMAPPPPGSPRRAGAMVGGGVALAAVGFVAGLVAGAFLAGGLDDGGW